MKKYIIYIGLLVTGLTLGWLIFGNSSKDSTTSEKNSSESKTEEIWTCSMHPQIRQPEAGDCPICGMDLIPLEANNNSNPLVFEMTDDAVKIANIQTTVIGSGSVDAKGLKLSGKIKADETNSASIVSHISGRIEKLFISYTGEKVSKGQKIASIYSPKLITAQKELLEANKVKDANPKLYEATVNKLKFWKITEEQIESIITSKEVIESFNIYAGFSGVVLNKKVSVGDYLNEGEVLFDIQNLNQLWAIFDVYETDLKGIKTGNKISFNTPAIPNKTFTSSIVFIDPVINPTTRTATIRTTINNQNQLLKPEMFLEGTINNTSSNNTAILVPKSAVLWTGERSVVYVKFPDLPIPSFEFREVTLGESNGTSYTILDGLNNGDEVVTNGAFVIDASAQLNNQSSMMNRNLLSNQSESLPDYTTSTPIEFKKQLGLVLENYLSIKNALVNSNVKESSKNSKSLIESLDKVDMKLVQGESHIFWMAQMKAITENTKGIIEATNISVQRDFFNSLSNTVISTTKSFGVEQNTFYVQFCPMAGNDKGAYWLSKEAEIKNPYFGDEMLTCGSIKETIDENFKNKGTKIKNSPMSGHNH
ncbi:efflux RND transporter periplasmic adaptor subunit [Putridiphycobacter roseus]|uniref:Efflux RND transporter periplasmic adaptor subunit n=1 Tax=Putridiphycobacter roseus TaxID=2219161 RepID=A0A2W1N0Q7_9FLAO|nr:efflux RND transporter periplasmic adaptor subunit [Putridiphycobacter roseus]PZE18169.1 efflux RND transporter periplasmic adaptor subunit [Putridiphycobacter roseus]